MGDLSQRLRTKIEQSLARGERPEYIAERLGVRLAWVDRVRRDMDRLNDAPDTEPREPGISLAELARAEMAAVYSATVPEHNTRSRPKAKKYTEWERAKLRAAARRLQPPGGAA